MTRRELVRRAVAHSRLLGLSATIVSLVSGFLRLKQSGMGLVFWLLIGGGAVAFTATVSFDLWRARRTRRLEWLRHVVRSPELKLAIVRDLIADFSGFLKAKILSERLCGDGVNARVVDLLSIEGRPGALLNIGAREMAQVGTPLLMYRTVTPADGGQSVESVLCLLKITYVQVGNNCSQAQIEYQGADARYWSSISKSLRQERHVQPPPNFVAPCVPPALAGLSVANLTALVSHLERIRDSLSRLCYSGSHAGKESQ